MKIDQILSNLSLADQNQISQLGIPIDEIRLQLNRFIHGFPPINLKKNASLGQGVRKISEDKQSFFLEKFTEAAKSKSICKFVPASGAASRMFRSLFAFMNNEEAEVTEEIQRLFDQIEAFAFYEDLKKSLENDGQNLSTLVEAKNFRLILSYLLTDKGLNYGQLPKALLQFHSYEDHTRTAIEEHLVEGAEYGVSAGNHVQLHFTVSSQHLPLVEKQLDQFIPHYEKKYPYRFSYQTSIQNPATDTLAVSPDNQPFRNERGELVFRPGGHGALLENLNQINTDFVFIKNVDNVVPDRLKGPTIRYKKLIGGVLVEYQAKIFDYLKKLDAQIESEDAALIDELFTFLQTELSIIPPQNIVGSNSQTQLNYIKKKLNRPIRVVGLITTDTNTGGGPFWAEEADGTVTLQIVETAQINVTDPEQKALMESSSYANITDLICGLKDFQGNRFDLMEFRDSDAGFISNKSQNGRDLKALELPGLWNGAMADWNTIFVEVPRETFNPVKTVMDLLSEGH